jgi:hypothetical protein
MDKRRTETPEPPAPPAERDGTAYSEEEEAEVRKRLEDLGYVE